MNDLVIDIFKGEAYRIINTLTIRPPEHISLQPVVRQTAAHCEGDLQFWQVLAGFRQFRAKDTGIEWIDIKNAVIVIWICVRKSRIFTVHKNMIGNEEIIGCKSNASILFQLLSDQLLILFPRYIGRPVCRLSPIPVLEFLDIRKQWIVFIHIKCHRSQRFVKLTSHGEFHTVVVRFQQGNAGIGKPLRVLFFMDLLGFPGNFLQNSPGFPLLVQPFGIVRA